MAKKTIEIDEELTALKGTPKTLNEAIMKGFREYYRAESALQKVVDRIEAHVMDFLNNKFTAAMLDEKEGEITRLYEAIKTKKG